MNINQILDYYTIVKQEMNWATQKFQDKKYKFYHKKTTKGVVHYYLPPTCYSVLKLNRDEALLPSLWQMDFSQKPLPAEVVERFKENKSIQDEILRIIKKRFEQFDYRCGIIEAKTGVGKTHICMDIIEYYKIPTLILVTNKKLMSEMIEKFEKHTNTKPSQYGDGKKELGDITVMTKTSFLGCPDKDLDFGIILVDECHQGFSPKFIKKLNVAFDGKEPFIYGLSATPKTDSLDQKDLEKFYGKTISVGKSYDFTPHFIFWNYTSSLDYEYANYVEHRTCLSEDSDRLDTQLRVISDNRTDCSLILCDRIADVDMYYEYFKNTENVIKITGSTKIKDDAANLESGLKNGNPILIIGSIQKCATGFDFPKIDSVFIFSSIKFENTVIQAIGRALRKYPGKRGATIHVWNDKTLNSQRKQKEQVISTEYKIHKNNIVTHKLGQIQRRKKSQVMLKL